MRRRLAAGLAGAAVLALGGVAAASADGPGAPASSLAPPVAPAATVAPAAVAPAAATPLVLVSGRDDHGEVASTRVAVYGSPGGTVAVGEVGDGTLARVERVEGTWLQVRTLEGGSVEGWVDDFHLRRNVHLVGPAPSCRAGLGGQVLPAGEQAVVLDVENGRARVRVVRTAATGWVPRSSVHELAPLAGCGVGAPPSAPGGDHHHH